MGDGPVTAGGPDETVVLVDEDGRVVGEAGKLAAHVAPGRLHRAVSVFVFSPDGRLLLQRRAAVKYHFAGRWSNTCCGHPRPGESAVGAGRRRLADEVGMDCPLEEVAVLRYEAGDPASGLVEREVDHLLVGVSDAAPEPNPAEVDEVRWVAVEDVLADLAARPGSYTPWLGEALALVAPFRPGPA